MRETLPAALTLMFGSEGGYSNAKTDSGGPTKYGITAKTLAAHRGVASVTADDVKAMTIDEATEIYERSYWAQSGGDLLPAGLDYAAFDFGVNSGPGTAAKKLQKVVGVREDGHIGEATIAAVQKYPGGIKQLIRDYCDARMAFLKSLTGSTGFSANGRGWTIRVTGVDPKGQWAAQLGVVGNALRLATDAPIQPAVVPATIPAGRADVKDTGLSTILAKPEALMPVVGTVLGGGALTSGNGPFQYAMAAAMVALVLVGLWYFVHRIREGK